MEYVFFAISVLFLVGLSAFLVIRIYRRIEEAFWSDNQETTGSE
jgi:hypothetical protein